MHGNRNVGGHSDASGWFMLGLLVTSTMTVPGTDPGTVPGTWFVFTVCSLAPDLSSLFLHLLNNLALFASTSRAMFLIASVTK